MRYVGIQKAVFVIVWQTKFQGSLFDDWSNCSAMCVVDRWKQMVSNMMIESAEEEIQEGVLCGEIDYGKYLMVRP